MIVENFADWFGTVQFTHKYLYRIGLVYTSGFRLRFRQATSFSARPNVKIYYCGTFASLCNKLGRLPQVTFGSLTRES
jgi:hypothetical protein